MFMMSRSGGLLGAADHETFVLAGGPGSTVNGKANTPAPARTMAVPLPAWVVRMVPLESMNAPPSKVANTGDWTRRGAAARGAPALALAAKLSAAELSVEPLGSE